MKTRVLGCGMVVLSVVIALLWVQITQGRQELIRILARGGEALGFLFLFGLAVIGIMLFLDGGVPED